MNVEQSCKILGTSINPDIEEVKRSYRKRAFDCHPDLHPNNPEASRKFRELNEAYVTLLHFLEEQPQTGKNYSQESGKEKEKGKEQKKQEKKSKKSYSTQSAQQKKERYQDFKNRTYKFGQEDILRNILNDPFATKVFEDIFRTVKRRKTDKKELKAPSPKKIQIQWGNRKLNIDLGKLGWSGFKQWMRSQLDHEQTLYLPPHRLLPGNKVKFQIRQRHKDPPTTVTARIPQDYHAGRPIRLKGLGRRLGRWKGDLYLKLLSKNL